MTFAHRFLLRIKSLPLIIRFLVPFGLATAALAAYPSSMSTAVNSESMKRDFRINKKMANEAHLPKHKHQENAVFIDDKSGTIYVELKPPFVVNTWPFTGAAAAASVVLSQGGKALDAVEQGVNYCELAQCDGTVGFGGSPAEDGSVFLDAMIIDGENHRTGSVLNLPNVKKAISVARAVMERTKHSILTGEAAGKFAAQMQFEVDPNRLRTPQSDAKWQAWLHNNCQPNFRQNVTPDATQNCGPYKPLRLYKRMVNQKKSQGHDTIGMIAVDIYGKLAIGTSTNGMTFKVPGRVADSAIPGSGGYAEKGVGGAVATGDGDVIVTYAPSVVGVERLASMHLRADEAAKSSLSRLSRHESPFSAALIVATPQGQVGAACVGFATFTISYWDSLGKTVRTAAVNCPPSF